MKSTIVERRINQSMKNKIKFINNEDVKNYEFPEVNYSLKKFTFSPLKFTGPRSYLSYNNELLYLITGSGRLFFTSLINLKKENFVFKKIETNFEKIAGRSYIRKYIRSQSITGYGVPIVTNILVKNDKMH